MKTEEARALYQALSYINGLSTREEIDSENIEVGLQCLTEALKLDLHNPEHQRQYGLPGAPSFPEIFHAGVEALGIQVPTEPAAASSSTSTTQVDDPIIQQNPDLWKKWMGKLEDKGFFKGTEDGSPEYLERVQKALKKFKEKFSDVKKEPVLSKEEKEKKAEEIKAEGNDAMKTGDHAKAAELYQKALNLSSDGPNSHIYHSNLAAALMHLGQYSEVIGHCEKAIALKPSYIKPYSRMGAAKMQLKDYDGAIESYRRGLEVDASNPACKEGLESAKAKLGSSQATTTSQSSAPPQGGMPDLSNLASMLGGNGQGLSEMMNNPAMQQMASSMMQNPAMMQMAQNMMSNPDMLNNLMGSLGGGNNANSSNNSSGGSPLSPEMASRLMNSPKLAELRSDPDMQDFFRDIDANGPSAAMNHLSNPTVASKLQSVISSLQ